jgi:hypothetical protein
MFATSSGAVRPYVLGRGGWAQASTSDVDVNGDGITDIEKLTQGGLVYGAGGGVLIGSPTASLDLGLVLHSVSLGDAAADGTTISNTHVGGAAIQVRAGVSLKLGRAR